MTSIRLSLITTQSAVPKLSGTYKTKKGKFHGFEQYIDLKLHGLSAMYLQKVKTKEKGKDEKAKNPKKS